MDELERSAVGGECRSRVALSADELKEIEEALPPALVAGQRCAAESMASLNR